MAAAGLGGIVLGRLICRSRQPTRPDEYLRVHTHANWLTGGNDAAGNEAFAMNAQSLSIYVPGDPARDWVLDGDWGSIAPRPGQRDIIHAADGTFYGIPWTLLAERDIRNLSREGKALIDHFTVRYQGGSASRDEDNFVRVTDLLRTGLISADPRAGLYEAGTDPRHERQRAGEL